MCRWLLKPAPRPSSVKCSVNVVGPAAETQFSQLSSVCVKIFHRCFLTSVQSLLYQGVQLCQTRLTDAPAATRRDMNVRQDHKDLRIWKCILIVFSDVWDLKVFCSQGFFGLNTFRLTMWWFVFLVWVTLLPWNLTRYTHYWVRCVVSLLLTLPLEDGWKMDLRGNSCVGWNQWSKIVLRMSFTGIGLVGTTNWLKIDRVWQQDCLFSNRSVSQQRLQSVLDIR